MTRERSKSGERAWALAHKQHGVITRQQLFELGFGEEAIEHRIATARLHRTYRGVYAVGWPQMTPKRRWMAAVLACGADAALSHSSAAALWEIGAEPGGKVNVVVRRRSAPRRRGIRARSRPSLLETEIVRRCDIPVTSVVRTLLDIASESKTRVLERMVNEADKRDLIDPETLRGEIERLAGAPGVRPLRALLDRSTFRLSDSDLEVRFRSIVASAELKMPVTKAWVNGFEVDFFWPQLGLVVETDGLRYHRTSSAQARDRLRDQTHTAAGMICLRFTHRQVAFEASYVREILCRTVSRLQPPLRGFPGLSPGKLR